MLTVKLVEPNGHEQIHEVEQVWTNAREDSVSTDGNQYPTVYAAPRKNEEPLRFSSSVVGTMLYVMNDNGKTIARYELA